MKDPHIQMSKICNWGTLNMTSINMTRYYDFFFFWWGGGGEGAVQRNRVRSGRSPKVTRFQGPVSRKSR